MNLLKESELLHKEYCLFIDNWYSSPTLYQELHNMKVELRELIGNKCLEN